MRSMFFGCWMVIAVANSAIAQDRTLLDEIDSLGEKHHTELVEARKLVDQGRASDSNRIFLELVRKNPSPAMLLWAGNELYRMDSQASYELHKKAYEARPEDRFTNLEFAMECHRRGEWAKAITLYEKSLDQKNDSRAYALLTDCLVRQGRLREAVSRWYKAGFRQHHTSIEKAIHEIYGEPLPAVERSRLLEQLRNGNKDAAEKLVRRLLFMTYDWWNTEPDRNALRADLPVIAKALDENSDRYKAIECLVSLSLLEESTGDATLEEFKVRKKLNEEKRHARLMESGYIIGGGQLPANSVVAAGLIQLVLDNQMEEPSALLKRFETELLSRANSDHGDQDALHLLCMLRIRDDDQRKLEEYDRLGWKRFKDQRFTDSLLLLLDRRNALTPGSPELLQALEEFPEDSFVHQVRIGLYPRDDVTREMLVAAIKAEFRRLSYGVVKRPSGQRLNSYFELLRDRLE
jgi:tetratricopeptide (TPR) repeat protein